MQLHVDLSAAAERGPPRRRDVKTSKQSVWAALCVASELGDVSKGSNIRFELVGSRLVPGNLKWLCVHSTVLSVHSGSVVAFFVAQLTLSLISESSVKLSNLTGRLCV